jgi:hypothetical protein
LLRNSVSPGKLPFLLLKLEIPNRKPQNRTVFKSLDRFRDFGTMVGDSIGIDGKTDLFGRKA